MTTCNQTDGDSVGLQRVAFPLMYQTLDEGLATSDFRQHFVPFVDSMDLSWMQMAGKLDVLCTHTILIPETGQLMPVHSLLLARKSCFFDALIKCTNDRHLKLPYDQCDSLAQTIVTVLECINNGEHAASIRDDNCLYLYQAADYLLYQDLREQVLSYIRTRCAVNLGLALDAWTLSEFYYLPELHKLAVDEILRSFTLVIEEPLWLELEFRLVHWLLQHDGINCSSELSVLNAVSRWLGAPESQAERAGHGEALLACVRRGLLSPTETVSLMQHEILASYPGMQALFGNYPMVPSQYAELYTKHSHLLAASATPREPHEAVMLFGGWCQEDGPRAACQVLNPRSNAWTMWSPNANRPSDCIGQIERRVYAGCLTVGDILHLIGGFDGERALNTVSCYNLREPGAGWYEGSCMLAKRYYVCCANVGGFVYAIGGHSGETQDRFGGRLDSVERLDINDNSWLPAASMRTVRSDAGGAAMGGRVYVAGGFNGQQYHDSAEVYDPSTDQWSFISRMNFPRGGVSLAAMGNTLYAIGGNDGQTRLSVVESYQHEDDGWVFSGRLMRQKSNLSTAVLEGGIMVMGGWSDQPTVGILASVEKFIPQADSTVQMADITYAASATSACTIVGRELVGKYIAKHVPQNPWLLVRSDVSATSAANQEASTGSEQQQQIIPSSQEL